jgi:transposase InsO family protein
MSHLPPAYHETSKHDSPNETKIKEKQNETVLDLNSNLVKSMTHHNQIKELTLGFSEVELDRCLITITNMGWLWHRRLAHVGMMNLHKLQKDGHILGLTNIVFENDRPYGACQAGKQVGTHHHAKNMMTTTRPLEMLHMDLFGPVAYIRIGSNKYGLVIIDNYSCFTWVFFLQDKSETQEVLKKFLRRAQNEFDVKVKRIRSDNDTEFKNTQVKDFLDEEGIKHEFSAPYTPQ